MRIAGYFSLALLLLSMGVPIAQARPQNQTPDQTQPETLPPGDQSTQPPADQPGAAIPESSEDVQSVNNPSPEPIPDRPLAGAQVLSLGAPPTGHTLWSPYLGVSATFDSNPLGSQVGWTTWSTLEGGIHLRRVSRLSDTTLLYDGSGWISNLGGGNTGGTNVSQVQQLGIAEAFNWGRYTIALMDQGAYLPEASFGYNAGTSLAGSASIGLQGGFGPSQLIITARGQRVNNTSVAQIDVHLTPRSSFIVIGSYGLLHYFQNNLINDTDTVLQAGYNYLLSRKDTIALVYQFAGYRFKNVNQSIDGNSVQISYGRRLTSRSTFQIAGGPDLAFSRRPIFATSGSSIAGTRSRQWLWSVAPAINYQFRRSTLGLSYFHGVSSGSGVLVGAIADYASALLNRQMSRSLDVLWLSGYSRNRGSSLSGNSQVYNYAFTGLSFDRRLGKALSVNAGYQAQYQTSNSAFCVSICGINLLRHQVQLGLRWSPRGNVEYGVLSASSGARTF